MSFKEKAYLTIGLFCFVFNSAISQDQRMADSLIAVYNSESFEGDELDILVRIVQEETNPDKNLEFSELLISRAAALDSTHYLYQGYLQKGNALHLKGNNSEALESYFKSLELANTNKDERGMGSVLISIADTYSVMDNSKNAELYYSRGIEALRRLNDSVKIATALLNAGDYYIRSGKQDTALAYTTESLDIFQRINYPLGQAYSMGNLGMIYAESQSDDLAERNINEAIFILEDLEDYYPITVYLTYMSDIYSRRDNHSAALSYAQRSLEMASLYGLKDQISEANLKLSELYQAAGDLSASYDHYKDHIVYRDSVMNIDNIQKMADLRTDFEVSQKQIEVDLAEQRSRNQRNISIATAIGLIMGTFSVASLVARPIAGKSIDRLGEKPVLLSGLFLIFICSLLYHLTPGRVVFIYILRIVHGIGFSGFIAAAFSTIAKFAPPETRGRAFSHNGATLLAALGFVPLASERLMDAFGHPAIFHGGAATTFLGFSLLVFTRKWEKISGSNGPKVRYTEILRNRSFFFVLVAMILFVDAQATVLHYFPLYAKTMGMSGGQFLGLALGLAVAIRLFGGGVLDRYSKLFIVRISFVLFGLGIILIYKLDSTLFYVLSILLYGSGLGYIFPALNAMGAEQGTLQQKPAMMSILTMVIDGGFILGSIFSGGLSDMIGLSNTFVFAGAVALLGVLVTSLAPITEHPWN